MNISLSFKAQFSALVESMEKRQTIRLRGKRIAQAGDTLHLFTGLRTRQCRKLMDVKCVQAFDLDVDTTCFMANEPGNPYFSDAWLDEFSKADGFASTFDFFDFFRQKYGESIHKMRVYRW